VREGVVAIAVVAVVLLLGAFGFGFAAYHGSLYITGTQFYEACWDKRAKQKADRSKAEPDTADPYQAVIWAKCNEIAAEAMDSEGMTLGSSADGAPAERKMLAPACPDRHTEIPLYLGYFYHVVLDAIQNSGGPRLLDKVAPAEWLARRALKARWPRCGDEVRRLLAEGVLKKGS
jgi:hypothetical protein